jgi:RNA polymerase primary sigma factor
MQNEDIQNPEHNLTHESLKIEIERSISSLISNEAEILRNYFGLNGKAQMSLDEIAYKFEISRERARQIKDKAIRHLRKYSRNRNLKSYLG